MINNSCFDTTIGVYYITCKNVILIDLYFHYWIQYLSMISWVFHLIILPARNANNQFIVIGVSFCGTNTKRIYFDYIYLILSVICILRETTKWIALLAWNLVVFVIHRFHQVFHILFPSSQTHPRQMLLCQQRVAFNIR